MMRATSASCRHSRPPRNSAVAQMNVGIWRALRRPPCFLAQRCFWCLDALGVRESLLSLLITAPELEAPHADCPDHSHGGGTAGGDCARSDPELAHPADDSGGSVCGRWHVGCYCAPLGRGPAGA